MIFHLQKRLIRICGIAELVVFSLIFILICVFSMIQLNDTIDLLTDRISDNDGRLLPPDPLDAHNFMTQETPFSTRFFVVEFDEDGEITALNLTSISSITEDEAREFAEEAYQKGRERGWEGSYRYKLYSTEEGKSVVYVDAGMNVFMTRRMLISVGLVLTISAFTIWFIIIFFSGRAVRPVAESYDKQKQFVTDANHELKTPLTLVMTNLDILETEIGENEWVTDIRSEAERMRGLINQLVILSRMDEDKTNLELREFSMSDMVSEAVSEFEALIIEKEKRLHVEISPDIKYTGDENELRRVLFILLDNAVKYCDAGGQITVRLEKHKYISIYIENTYEAVNEVDLDRLFDRFYRNDKARTCDGSYGLGLSIAKAIVNQHKGTITACKKDNSNIGFKIVLKQGK